MKPKLMRFERPPVLRAIQARGWREFVGPAVLMSIALALVWIRVASEPDGSAGARLNVLFEAAQRGDVAEVARAIDRGEVSVDQVEAGSDMSLLMWAVRRQRTDLVEWLLTHGADVDVRTRQGTALVTAPSDEGGSAAIVRLLLERGADPNGCDPDGHTALMNAAMWGDAASAELLIRAGARVDARDRFGATALAFARTGDHAELARLLLAAGAGRTE